MPEDTIDVRMPDGVLVRGVPSNITQSELLKRYSKSPLPPTQQSAAESSPTSMRGVSPLEHYTRMVGETLPSIGGLVGGGLGMAAAGPLGAPGGAAIGGGIGKAIQQVGYHAAGIPNMPSPGESLKQVGVEAGDQAITEGVAQLATPALKPVAGMLARSAPKVMASALKPSGTAARATAEDLAGGLIRTNTTAMTRGSLERQIQKNITEAGSSLQAELSKIPKGTPVNMQKIMDGLENYKQAAMVPVEQGGYLPSKGGATKFFSSGETTPGSASEWGDAVKRVIEKVQTNMARMGPDASFENVRKVKQQMDRFIGERGSDPAKEEVNKKIKEDAVDIIRRELTSTHPKVANLDAQYSYWKDVESAFNNTPKEPSMWEKARYVRYGLGAAGSLAGMRDDSTSGKLMEAGSAALLLDSALRSTAWKTTSAVARARLANAIYDSNATQVARIASRIVQAGSRMSNVPPLPQPEKPEATQ